MIASLFEIFKIGMARVLVVSDLAVEDPGVGGVVAGLFGGQFQEPDQVLVDVEEGRGGRGAQGQLDDRVLAGGEFLRERQGHSREAARGYPQGVRRLLVG